MLKYVGGKAEKHMMSNETGRCRATFARSNYSILLTFYQMFRNLWESQGQASMPFADVTTLEEFCPELSYYGDTEDLRLCFSANPRCPCCCHQQGSADLLQGLPVTQWIRMDPNKREKQPQH